MSSVSRPQQSRRAVVRDLGPKLPVPAPAPAPNTCTLTLRVGSDAYTVRVLSREPGDESVRCVRMTKTDRSAVYYVGEHPADLPHTCDCPDYEFRRDGLDPLGCKHIKALVAVGILSAPVLYWPTTAGKGGA